MKQQFFAAVMTAMAMVSGMTGSAAAADNPQVRVTIIDGSGAIVLAQAAVSVSDIDGDGAYTIHDALTLAHDACYPGGAAAGYAAQTTDYGLSMAKLWGTENGGSYGYTVNHASAMSLADPIADGDLLTAYCYTDLTAWSDTYAWFDVDAAAAEVGESLTLTLSAQGFDENWNAVTLPVAGATLTCNGNATEFVTDENGVVTLTLDTAGIYQISAASDSMVLVPPLCMLTVGDASETTTTAETTTTTTAVTTTTNPPAPQTGDPGSGLLWAGLAAAVLCVALKKHEA